MHAHFNCERCGRTFCLQTTQVPLVTLPGNFQVHSINYVLKGLCPECNVQDAS
jgi:Fur family ferric uptake transcriptional regulator